MLNVTLPVGIAPSKYLLTFAMIVISSPYTKFISSIVISGVTLLTLTLTLLVEVL